MASYKVIYGTLNTQFIDQLIQWLFINAFSYYFFFLFFIFLFLFYVGLLEDL